MDKTATHLSDYMHWFVDERGRHWKLGPLCCITKGVQFKNSVLKRKYTFFVGTVGSVPADRLQEFFDESVVSWIRPGWECDEDERMTYRPGLSLLFRALRFAADHHRDGRRKGVDASPYINHPIAVASELVSVSVEDPEVLAAALLHDTVEDTCATPEDLEREFGPRVRELVEAVTDDKSLPSHERKRLQVEHAPGLEPDAKLIKIADKICNVFDVGHAPAEGWSLERRREYVDWTERVVAGCRGINSELEARYDDVLRDARARVDAETGGDE